MFSRLLFTLVLAAAVSRGAVITTQTDTNLEGATANGVIAANEYGPANTYRFTGGGTGFGGGLGNSTQFVNAASLWLNIGFSNLGIPVNEDMVLVYLDTRPGGFQPSGEMSDAADFIRANISRLSTGGVESVTFVDGVTTGKPDFVLAINNRSTGGFAALYELRGAGQSHGVIPITVAGLGTATPEFRLPLGPLGATGTIGLVTFFISGTGFLSGEGIPNLGMGAANYGFNTGNTNAFGDFHRFLYPSVGTYTGLTTRAPNVTLAMPQAPPVQAAFTYTFEDGFPTVAFTNPIYVASPPGETNRLFVVERAGRIVVITNLAAPTRTVFMDIASRVNPAGEGGLLSLAFHPEFAANGQFFVFYTATGTGFSNRVARFTTLAGNPNRGDTNSQVVLFGQFDEASNHNGGTVEFGPDGYLYVSLGDEGGGNDAYTNAPYIDRDFFCAILRLDVDKKPGSLAPNPHPAINGPTTNYAIPPDNPYIGITSFYGTNVNPARVRTEFFAFGMRNPFRFSIDDITGDVYVGDVGQNAFEEVNLVTNGGHYGWAYREGFIGGPRSTTNPASSFASPLVAYGRSFATNGGFSITGGFVYRGDRLPELVGNYIYGDYVSGNVWAMTHNGVTNTSVKWLLADNEIAAFGADPRNGDILACDLVANQIKRLVRSAAATSALPDTLYATGVFRDLQTLTPHEGIVPYALNLPFWSDNAVKSRWFSIPDTTSVVQFSAESTWQFPTGMVWIKHFDLQLTNGDPTSVRRLETRLLVKNASGAGGYGVTYRWGSSFSDATLVPEAGLNEEILIDDGGTIRTQVWRYPSRQECLACHGSATFALGFDTLQLNRDFGYAPGDVTNQLRRLSTAGYLNTNLASVHGLLAVAHITNTEVSVEYRARSYLQVNCANCHFPGGPVPAAFDARLSTPLHNANILNGALANTFGDPNQRVARPGVLTNSMVHTRINTRGPGQMPPLASSVIDTQGVAIIAAWISGSMTNARTYAEWQATFFGSTNAPGSGPDEDPDDDGAPNRLEYATDRNPTNDASFWNVAGLDTANGPQVVFDALANRGFLVEVTTNLVDGEWRLVDTATNRPVFRAADEVVSIPDPSATNDEFRTYRVRVIEP